VILSNREIKLTLERGRVRITPLPSGVHGRRSGLGGSADCLPTSPGRKRRLIFSPADADFSFSALLTCQLLFEEVHGTPEKGYEGLFAVQGPGEP
jgi:hypothetical protein